MSDNAIEIIEDDDVQVITKNSNEKTAEENNDNSAAKVNGTEVDAKKEDATSPMPGPGELENMTVVDEDVEMLSDDEEDKTSGSKEEAAENDTKSESLNEDDKQGVKRKSEETSESSKSKKRNGSEDIENNGDAKSDAKEDSSKNDDETKGKSESTAKSSSKNDRSSKNDSKIDRNSRSDRISKNDRNLKTDDKPKEKSKSSSDSKEKDGPKQLPLLEKYWKAVKDDPTDFTGWTYLLQYVDQANDIKAASEVYDDFLSRYPYCYGYWRKYADYLKKNGHKDKCEEIFEKGVTAIPLSVDLWIHYLNYIKDAYADDEPTVRKLFERSLKSCGLEFRSDRLWDAYIKWEVDNGNLLRITNIFDRWLKVPTQGYVSVMDKFKDHVKKNSPNKILDPDEFFTLRNEVLNETRANNTEMECKLSDDAPPGEEAPDKLDQMNEEETKALKEKIVNNRKDTHKSTQKEALARWSYEENIKRPYFHVKPLEQCQLNNWKDYLDFEIKEGKQDRIILLFERCLIACALYEEFWTKFVDYLLSLPEVPVDKVREVFVRACTIHHMKKLGIHLRWAAFEESHGDSAKASEILEKLEKECPNVLCVILRRVNVLRRRRDFDQVCSLYELYIEQNADKREFVSSLSIKYARFCCKFLKNVDKGIEILKAAIEKDKASSRLKLQLIDIYMNQTPVNEVEIVKVMDEVIENENELEKKLLFAQRKLEFLEEFSDSSTAKFMLEVPVTKNLEWNGSGFGFLEPPHFQANSVLLDEPIAGLSFTPANELTQEGESDYSPVNKINSPSKRLTVDSATSNSKEKSGKNKCCLICNKSSHFFRDCQYYHLVYGKCFNCGTPGHRDDQCPHPVYPVRFISRVYANLEGGQTNDSSGASGGVSNPLPRRKKAVARVSAVKPVKRLADHKKIVGEQPGKLNNVQKDWKAPRCRICRHRGHLSTECIKDRNEPDNKNNKKPVHRAVDYRTVTPSNCPNENLFNVDHNMQGMSGKNYVQKAQEVYDAQVKLVAEKKKLAEEKRPESSTKKNGAAEPSGAAVAAATYQPATGAPTYYQPPASTTYQTYPQGYLAAATQYPQQSIYAQGDPNYSYTNWQSYNAATAYNQTWAAGAAPQAGAASSYNYMY